MCLGFRYAVLFSAAVFFPRGDAAADMPLRLVDVQHGAYLVVQSRVEPPQPLRHVGMYRGFAHAELLCRFAHRRFVFHDIFAQLHGAFFYKFFHIVRLLSCHCNRMHDRVGI